MDRARSLGHSALLAALLVGAWIPAAMIASPSARATASATEAPAVEVSPASEEPQEVASEAMLRTA